MEPELRFLDGEISICLDLRVYRLSAVKKAAYRLAHQFTALIGVPDDYLLGIRLKFKPGTSEASAHEAARSFFQELLDYELREQIAEETNAVRTLILAHAFSKADLIKRDP
ncbi:MAG: His-Xaa-Ser system protein HxsD [Kofleriaceae bacterium]